MIRAASAILILVAAASLFWVVIGRDLRSPDSILDRTIHPKPEQVQRNIIKEFESQLSDSAEIDFNRKNHEHTEPRARLNYIYSDAENGLRHLNEVKQKSQELRRLAGLSGTVQQFTSRTPSEVTNFEDFTILHSDENANEWEFQLDGRESWRNTSVFTDSDKDSHVVFIADPGSKLCPGSPDPCSGPNGLFGLSKLSLHNPMDFAIRDGDANAYALLARFDKLPAFQVGAGKKVQVPLGQHEIMLTHNVRQQYLHVVTGGFRVKIRIIHKN
jgi:hypothetical protein